MVASVKNRFTFGWIGASCLLLIIPLKALRWSELMASSTIVGTAPSFLGTAGLLFLMMSSSSPRLARLTLLQTTAAAGGIALGLEFIQLLPRPGILANVHYTFDWWDVAASMFSLLVGFIIARRISRRKQSPP